MALSADPTDNCDLLEHLSYQAEFSLCWKVTISNPGEDTISINGFKLGNVTAPDNFLGARKIEDVSGKPVVFPYPIDPGHSLEAIVRVPVTIPNNASFSDSYLYLIKHQGDLKRPSLADFRGQVFGFDFVGNPTEIARRDGTFEGWDYHLPPKIFFRFIGTFTTTRGDHRSIVLSYPQADAGPTPDQY